MPATTERGVREEQASSGSEGTIAICPRGSVAPKVAERKSSASKDVLAVPTLAPLELTAGDDDGDDGCDAETISFPESTCRREQYSSGSASKVWAHLCYSKCFVHR